MKKVIATLALLLIAATASAQDMLLTNSAFQGRTAFSNVGASLNAGLTGFGASFSTPLSKHFNLRAGFGTFPYTYKYTIDQLTLDISDQLQQYGVPGNFSATIDHEVDLKAKLKLPETHFLVDFTPGGQGMGAFHITAGLYAGGSNLIHVNGNSNLAALQGKVDNLRNQINAQYPGVGDLLDINVTDLSFELGDAGVHLNADGTANAYAKVNSIRPYLGIGWGNAIPRGRVGFRFDIGAMYQGKPKITSPNVDNDLSSEFTNDELVDKILRNAKFYPQISFQLTFRLMNDK